MSKLKKMSSLKIKGKLTTLKIFFQLLTAPSEIWNSLKVEYNKIHLRHLRMKTLDIHLSSFNSLVLLKTRVIIIQALLIKDPKLNH